MCSLEWKYLLDIGIQPDGLPQVKFAADLIQSLKDHGSAGHGVVPVGGHGIQEQMIVLPELSPHTEHIVSPFGLQPDVLFINIRNC